VAIAAVAIWLVAVPAATAAVSGSLQPSATTTPAVSPDALRTAKEIAGALRTRGVYADPRAKPTLTPPEQARLEALIAQQDPTRIKIAVTTPGVARRAGDLHKLASDVDVALDGPGTVIVIAGEDAYLITAYDDTDAAVNAARATLNDKGTLAAQLRNFIVAIAALDPDRGKVKEAPQPKPKSGSSGSGKSSKSDSGNDTVNTIIGLVVIFSIIGIPIWVAIRRSRRKRGASTKTQAAGFSADMAQKEARVSSNDSIDQANKAFGHDD
jgi:hypothetical protein